jgi:hypothetical protein
MRDRGGQNPPQELPPDKREASQESKDEILLLADQLTERVQPSKKPWRATTFPLSDGREISVTYTPKDRTEEAYDNKRVTVTINSRITGREAKPNFVPMQQVSYSLLENGLLERTTKEWNDPIVEESPEVEKVIPSYQETPEKDLDTLSEEELEEELRVRKGELLAREEELRLWKEEEQRLASEVSRLMDISNSLAAQMEAHQVSVNEAKKLGLLKMTEAEAQEVISLLRSLLELKKPEQEAQ